MAEADEIPGPAEGASPTGNTENSSESTPPPGEIMRPGRQGRLGNLTPWVKGQSGNPRGRPKRGPGTDALAYIMDQPISRENLKKIRAGGKVPLPKKPTYIDLAMYALTQQALKGNMAAIRELLNRLEGRIPHKVNMTPTDRLDELARALAAGPVEPGQTNPPPDDEDLEDDD